MVSIQRAIEGNENEKAPLKEPPRTLKKDEPSVVEDLVVEAACRGWGIDDALWNES